MKIGWNRAACLAAGMALVTVMGGYGQFQPRGFVPDRSGGPVAGENWISPSTGMEFVWISRMRMWVGKFEVTNGEYRRKEPDHDSRSLDNHCLNGDRQPVVFVDFDDAKAYAEWMTEQDRAVLGGARYRLPSEDEFTRYAQCGRNWEYPWGNRWPPRSGHAGNYHGEEGALWRTQGFIEGYNDGHPVTCNVEESWENSWGLFGVGGNVSEFCASDGAGESFGSWRGASWRDHHQGHLRVLAGRGLGGSRRRDYIGFRLVLPPQ